MQADPEAILTGTAWQLYLGPWIEATTSALPGDGVLEQWRSVQRVPGLNVCDVRSRSGARLLGNGLGYLFETGDDPRNGEKSETH